MTPPIGFRTDKTSDSDGTLVAIRPAAAITGASTPEASNSSRAADYAYRIATLTAGLVLLATVM